MPRPTVPGAVGGIRTIIANPGQIGGASTGQNQPVVIRSGHYKPTFCLQVEIFRDENLWPYIGKMKKALSFYMDKQ